MRIDKSLSRFGFGSSGIGNLYQVISQEQAHEAVAAALSVGVTYFDTAPHYGFGLSEKRLGASLRTLDPEQNVVVSTKVGRTLAAVPKVDVSVPRQGFI